ncbi:hypothetical protein NPIL_289111 [Nephila pilipes]|uniref:Uncharacterized protein n=1 Tax=Nephila pilipes TaxID=299642 RepID=A0A8X6NQS7_NEPPI|nr:hypothetical protein NPIL_289111 [Nephila pilipes]
MSTLHSHPSEDLLHWRPTYPNSGMRVSSSFGVLPEIFFSGKENMSDIVDSIHYGVMFHKIPANLACVYLKGHLIGKARDWFDVIDQVRIYPRRERAEGVVETDGLNDERARAEQVEIEGSKGQGREKWENHEND